MLSSDHPVWSVLTEDLALELLDEIPHMTKFFSKALVTLALILLQHPKAALLMPKWGSFYLHGSGAFASIAGSISTFGPDSIPAVDDSGSPTAAATIDPDHDQLLAAASNAISEGPITPSGGVCCRNGKKAGLGGSGASGSGRAKRKGGGGVEDEEEGGARPSKRSKGLDGGGEGSGSGDGDGGGVPDKGTEVRGNGDEVPDGGNAVGESGKAPGGRGHGKPPGGGGKGKGKGGKGKGSGKGCKKKAPGNDADSERVWLTDGVPPRLNDGARDLFEQLTSLHSNSAMGSLTSLLHDFMSGSSLDVDLVGYNLSFTSLLSQCSKLSSTKAAKDFYVAILYIRISIHVDQ
jgi:hypothetical protein